MNRLVKLLFLSIAIILSFNLSVIASEYSFEKCSACLETIEEAYENGDIDKETKIIYIAYLYYNPYYLPSKFRCSQHKDNIESIKILKDNLKKYLGKRVVLEGLFMGWGSKYGPPPVTRSDWVVEDATDYIYVVGNFPPGLLPEKSSQGTQIRVAGFLRKTEGHKVNSYYLDAVKVEIIKK